MFGESRGPPLLPPTTRLNELVSEVDVAAVWVEKARSGSVQWVDSCSVGQMQAYRFRKRLKPVTTLAKYSLLALAIFERPSWCLKDASACPGPAHPELHAAGAPMLDITTSNIISIVIWSYFAFMLLLRRRALGDAHCLDTLQICGVCAHLVAFADCVVALFNVTGIVPGPGTFRIARLLRPFIFLFYTKSIREAGQRVLQSIPGFADALLALLFSVLLFSWFGLILFAETKEGETYFSSWVSALSNMWILFTTANSPDLYVPIYTRHRVSFVFFFLYTVLTLYLVSNILLAFVFDAYKQKLKEHVKLHYKNQAKAMQHAFALLQHQGSIGPKTWSAFFNAYFAHHYHAWDMRSGSIVAKQVFNAMDKDHNMGIDEQEFKAVLKVLLDSETYIAPDSAVRSRPSQLLVWRKWLQKTCFFSSTGKPVFPWDDMMDAVIFVGVLLTLVQTFLFLGPSSTLHGWFMTTYKIMAVFSLIYIVELTVKISILGFPRFWYTKVFFHRIDFFNVYGLCAIEIYNLIVHGSNPLTIRIAILLHITRSLRVLRHIEALNFITQMLIRLAPTYWRMCMLLILVYYTYATIGVEVFGGDIYEGRKDLAKSGYAAANYWAFNFNDFVSGMVTLFVLMVGNNWQVFAGAFIQASGSKWAAAFFVSFAVVSDLIVLNILMALILECSQSLREELQHEGSQEDSSDEEASRGTESHDFSYEAMIRKVLLDSDDLAEIERDISFESPPGSPRTSSSRRRSYGSILDF
mmetsp:Transcript_28807/g.67030  ORF Transcript_28807/g.67030 Transcript_28807/m.67030 type:complete len:751 (+) Transcript_28807:123-2375(+)